jgi:class 3 adenylate cyclase
MEGIGVKRRLTCILAADAVGYSKLMSQDEANTLRVLAAHRAVIDGVIAFHDGRIVSTAGDSVLAEFGSAVEAVRCAVEIQDALRTRNEALPEESRMLFRVGVNLGDVVVKGSDLLGDGVNIAARLESIADPGGIVISSSVYDQITGKLDLGFHDIGNQDLKNITHPVRAFKVSGAGGTVRAPVPPRKTGSRMPWAAAAVAVLAALALLAWKIGWLGPQGPSGTSAGTAVDAERARLQAELAAAEKARQDAESRARTADAEAVRARAENEAAALKSKAATEAAAMKAKAEADAAAVRSRSDLEAQKARAERTKADSEAAAAKAAADAASARARDEAAAATARANLQAESAKAAGAVPAVAAAPAARRLDPGIYDGNWTANMACEGFEELPAGSQTFPVSAAGGLFTMEWGTKDGTGGGHAEGRPGADGSLTLRGTTIGRSKRAMGKTIGVRFDGAAAGQRFELRGHIGTRNCTLSLARAG